MCSEISRSKLIQLVIVSFLLFSPTYGADVAVVADTNSSSWTTWILLGLGLTALYTFRNTIYNYFFPTIPSNQNAQQYRQQYPQQGVDPTLGVNMGQYHYAYPQPPCYGGYGESYYSTEAYACQPYYRRAKRSVKKIFDDKTSQTLDVSKDPELKAYQILKNASNNNPLLNFTKSETLRKFETGTGTQQFWCALFKGRIDQYGKCLLPTISFITEISVKEPIKKNVSKSAKTVWNYSLRTGKL